MSGLEGLLAGRVLVNRYRVEEVIGRGGFAAVYRADDLRLGRPVAVKVITLSAGDAALRDGLRERFQREARAAAGLPHHPNLVAVHDFGTDAELDLDFLVMELLRGEDLATYLAAQPRPPLELAVAVLVDAGEGLAVGHRAGLVHRDVKPGNLFLAEPHGGEPFRVCVLDYGIARLQEEEQTQTRLTQEGHAPLSPAYASPEQLRGEMDLTPASDVFSLGVVGYQLLTGERPFGAERRHRREGEAEPVRPLRELAPEVPAAVEAVIARALGERPEDRFADAGEMAAALSAAVRTTSVDGDDGDDGEATVLTPAVVVAAPAPAAPPPVDDDATLIQAPSARASAPPRAAIPPTSAPPVRPAPVRETAPPPVSRRRGMGGVLVALLLLVGAAFAGWMFFGGDGEGARPADADAVVVEGEMPEGETEPVVVTEPATTEPDASGTDVDGSPAPAASTGEPSTAPSAGTSPTPPATGGTTTPTPQPATPATPTTPGATPATQPQPQPQPVPQPQPAPTTPQPQPQPTPQPLPPEPRPEPLPPTPLPRPVIPSPFPAPRDTIRIRPLPGRPVPDAAVAAPTR